MKKKVLSLLVSAGILLSVSSVPDLALTPEEEQGDPEGVFSAEYMTSPYYSSLMAALEESSGKSTMEKTLAAALSQEGYKNYSLDDVDIEQARTDGLLWTGSELRMNPYETGNTEYTRWAQSCVMGRSGQSLYIDCDWCAIFTSWCMYQAGYYSEEQLKEYYYSYCADPRIEFEASTWIEAFCLEQENVWYTPSAARKLAAYDWNTYYHTDISPYDIPYKPGGLIFFNWNGTGDYFSHVGIVVDYDPDEHILNYINGNVQGQVSLSTMDLDVEEEFHGMPFLKNSIRIMAYGEYDEVRPLEEKEITAETNRMVWDKSASSGIRIQTDSLSKIVSVYVDGEYLGSNIESNMLLREGKVAIGKSEIVGLSTGNHLISLVFDDGTVLLSFKVTDTENEEEKQITAEEDSITWDRSDDSIVIITDSQADSVLLRINDELAGTEKDEGITVENGTVTLSPEFANSILADEGNKVELIFPEGETTVSIFVTNNKVITPEQSDISWERGGDSIVIVTDSTSDTVAVRIAGGLAGTEETDGITVENGTVTLSPEFAGSVLENGENSIRLIFSDGEAEVSIFVTEKAEEPQEPEEPEEPVEPEEPAGPEEPIQPVEPETPEEPGSTDPQGGSEPAGTDNPDSGNTGGTSTPDSGKIPTGTSVPETGDAYPLVIMLTAVISGCAAVLAIKKRSNTSEKQ